MNTAGARVLVVGGVRRLGGALARDLAAHGAAVAISSRRADDELEAAAGRLRELGAAAVATVAGDVGTRDGASRLVSAGAGALKGLDAVLFAASGPFRPSPPERLTEADWDASLDVIAKGFFFTACAARDHFVGQRRAPAPSPRAGVVIALTDCMGIQPWGSFAAHGAAKAAQIHLVKQLARAWAGDGVRVCGIAPGPVDLDDDEHREATLRAATRGEWTRIVTAADVGRAVRFCLENDSVTGQNVIVDNGTLLTS